MDKNPKKKKHTRLPLRRISREWALRYLYQLDVSQEEMSDFSLGWFWGQVDESEDKLGDREKRKCRKQALELITGVLDHIEELDKRIDQEATNWDIERIAAVDRNILRIGTYEIFHAEKVPGPVSINEALEICRSYGGGEESRPLINGILDKILRTFEAGKLED
jgi:transcription antitermination factor NusB